MHILFVPLHKRFLEFILWSQFHLCPSKRKLVATIISYEEKNDTSILFFLLPKGFNNIKTGFKKGLCHHHRFNNLQYHFFIHAMAVPASSRSSLLMQQHGPLGASLGLHSSQ